ncbi:hypothetical protein AV656_11405 [Bhargavaea cecembensis]|uniref:Uncharacterized protein n=1 Tax=Bhargavaea cecembensis TaxID=394098 RepID=A0A161SPU4_9BACL|nr:hypothetical protein [Bhargavaea cecembensis]KZE37180.1 hypothetical protein AV656_11405 [Bhargavaea cecembensis]
MKKDIKIGYRELDAKGKFIRTIWGGALALAFLYWVVAAAEAHRDFDNVFLRVWFPLIATLLVIGDMVHSYRKWKKEEKSKQ